MAVLSDCAKYRGDDYGAVLLQEAVLVVLVVQEVDVEASAAASAASESEEGRAPRVVSKLAERSNRKWACRLTHLDLRDWGSAERAGSAPGRDGCRSLSSFELSRSMGTSSRSR